MHSAVASSLASVLLLAAASHAAAQSQPAPSAPAARPSGEAAVADVVVTGERAAVRTAIDRTVYNVSRDIAAANGSVSDVLRNLPQVEVDLEGQVSVRGAGARILVDGRPSALFTGEQTAISLQQMQANTVESIEVITNPSAEFGPDGAGGVINIVTKKVRKVGKSGSLYATGGSFGRWGANVSGAYNAAPLTITGALGVRRQGSAQSATSTSTLIDPIIGVRTDAVGANAGEMRNLYYNASSQIDYDLNSRDRLSLNLNFNTGGSERYNGSTELRTDGLGVVTRDYAIDFTGDADGSSGAVGAVWRRTFAEAGRTFTVTASYSEGNTLSLQHLVYDNRVPAGSRDEHRSTDNTSSGVNLTTAYVHPLAANASLRVGYDYRRSETGQDVVGLLVDPSGVATNLPNLTNDFVYVQANHQAYATYQRPFGKLTVLAGARLELAQTEYDQRTTAITGANDYVDIHPSLHLQYQLTEHHTLSASYSHRVDRPVGSQLNPFLIISNEFSASSGNPDLRPQETHSLEGGWRWQKGARSTGATVYYRQNYNTIGGVSRFLTPLIVLNTLENQGTSAAGGLALDTGGRIGETISYRVNGTLSYSELQRSTLGGGDTRSAFAHTFGGNLDYRPTAQDLLQATGNYSSKRINAQGYSEPSWTMNLGYQRKIRQDLIVLVNVSDVFASTRFITVTDTRTLFGRSVTEPAGRTFSISITRLFGGRTARDGQFEYDVAQPGG